MIIKTRGALKEFLPSMLEENYMFIENNAKINQGGNHYKIINYINYSNVLNEVFGTTYAQQIMNNAVIKNIILFVIIIILCLLYHLLMVK